MDILWLDLETYSPVSISHGGYAYAEEAEVLLMTYAFNDGEVQIWDRYDNDDTQPFDELYDWIQDPEVRVIAHNSQFDRNILRHIGRDIPIERWRDTMAQARAHALPGKLEMLCKLFGLAEEDAKLSDGKDLINFFCNVKMHADGRPTAETHPEKWQRFRAYAVNDVISMRILAKRMPKFNYNPFGEELKPEESIWMLDQYINDRGIAIDMPLVTKAVDVVTTRRQEISDGMREETDNAVTKATQLKRLKDFLQECYGVSLPDMKASTLQRRIGDPEMPEAVRSLLMRSAAFNKASVSKYKTLLTHVSSDERLRGSLAYSAARTGRWGGRGFQPQNLPRPTESSKMMNVQIEAFKKGDLELITNDVLDFARNAIRGSIIAAPGKKFLIADLSNIESRVLAWLAGEQNALQTFMDFDAGVGVDPYVSAYAQTFNVDPESVTKDERSIGKTLVLALGYGGGVGAFLVGAESASLDVQTVVEHTYKALDASIFDEAEGMLEWFKDHKRSLHGLDERTWIAIEALVLAWRQANPNIKAFWRSLDNAVRQVMDGASPVAVGLLFVMQWGKYTMIVLPSGRCLMYAAMQLSKHSEEDPDPEAVEGESSGGLVYYGVRSVSTSWGRIPVYGGKFAENVTQAVARDVLAWNMLELERKGYSIVLTVHDEVIVECPDTAEYSLQTVIDTLTQPLPWTEGLPLAAKGEQTYRYGK